MVGDCPGEDLSRVSFVAVDTETTGLSWRECKLLELAAVRFNLAGEITGQYAQLIDPCCPIPPGATAVHGITDAMVVGKSTIDFALPAFFEFLEAQDSVVLIHNAPFDLGFIREAARRIGNKCPKHPVICTLQLARRRLPELSHHRMDTLVAHFREADRAEHRAAGDAEMLRRIFLKMMQREPVVRTMEDLLRYARVRQFEAVEVRAVRRFVPRWRRW